MINRLLGALVLVALLLLLTNLLPNPQHDGASASDTQRVVFDLRAQSANLRQAEIDALLAPYSGKLMLERLVPPPSPDQLLVVTIPYDHPLIAATRRGDPRAKIRKLELAQARQAAPEPAAEVEVRTPLLPPVTTAAAVPAAVAATPVKSLPPSMNTVAKPAAPPPVVDQTDLEIAAVAPPSAVAAEKLPVKPEAKPEPKQAPRPDFLTEEKSKPKVTTKPAEKMPVATAKPAAKPETKESSDQVVAAAEALQAEAEGLELPPDNATPAPVKPFEATAKPSAKPVKEKPAAEKAAADSGESWFVQVGVFSQQTNADQAAQNLKAAGLPTRVTVLDTPAGERQRVRVGPYASREQAHTARVRVGALGYPEAQVVGEQ